MSMSNDLRDYLISEGIGPIILEEYPDTPDTVICLFRRPGMARHLESDIEEPELAVHVRASKLADADALLGSVAAALHSFKEVTLNTKRYLLVRALGEPQSLGRDV